MNRFVLAGSLPFSLEFVETRGTEPAFGEVEWYSCTIFWYTPLLVLTGHFENWCTNLLEDSDVLLNLTPTPIQFLPHLRLRVFCTEVVDVVEQLGKQRGGLPGWY